MVLQAADAESCDQTRDRSPSPLPLPLPPSLCLSAAGGGGGGSSGSDPELGSAMNRVLFHKLQSVTFVGVCFYGV